MIAGIEAGGTKFVCGVFNKDLELIDKVVIPTRKPDDTMNDVLDFLNKYEIEAIGVGSFGPVDLNKESSTYGFITSTPKVGWNNYDIIGFLKNHFNVPIGFDTDVNAACLAESKIGGAKGCNNAVYITVGTGIGCGVIVNNQLLHGLMHPEAGHMFVRKHKDDNFEGSCKYHGDCLEGLASGPSIEKRYGIKGKDITDSKVWEIEAYYLAQSIVNLILTLSPEKVILGGGVMHQSELLPLVRKNVVTILNGYVDKEEITKNIDNYIVSPGLGDNAGLYGSMLLGLNEMK